MTVDDPFPPVDPIVQTPRAQKVIPRRRRFGQKSRELQNELNREHKKLRDMKDGEGSGDTQDEAVGSNPGPSPKFDTLA